MLKNASKFKENFIIYLFIYLFIYRFLYKLPLSISGFLKINEGTTMSLFGKSSINFFNAILNNIIDLLTLNFETISLTNRSFSLNF